VVSDMLDQYMLTFYQFTLTSI